MKRDVLLSAFDRLVSRAPGSVFAASELHSSSLAEVGALARAAARPLSALDLPPRSIVALAALNGTGLAASLVATLRAGHVALLVDGAIKHDELERALARLPVAALLRCRVSWPSTDQDFTCDSLPNTLDRGELPEATTVILLTSASTGLPRGVACSSEQLFADYEALARAIGLGPEDRLLAAIPLTHAYGLATLLFPALVRGNPLILPEGTGPFQSLAAAHAGDATVFPTVPSYMAALLQFAEPPPLPRSLKRVLSAGARLPPETAARWHERYGLGVHSLYGSTECGGIAYDREGRAAERGTVGELVDGVTVTLEPHDPLINGAGRVVVASPAVALAYVPSEASKLSRGKFVSDDLGEWVRGELKLLGRLNDTIHVRGEKVDPREVESVIAALPGVREVHVLGLPQPGSPDPVVTAVVACSPGTLTPVEVAGWCRQRLGGVKVPRSILLLDELPRGPRGKVDVAAIRARIDS